LQPGAGASFHPPASSKLTDWLTFPASKPAAESAGVFPGSILGSQLQARHSLPVHVLGVTAASSCSSSSFAVHLAADARPEMQSSKGIAASSFQAKPSAPVHGSGKTAPLATTATIASSGCSFNSLQAPPSSDGGIVNHSGMPLAGSTVQTKYSAPAHGLGRPALSVATTTSATRGCSFNSLQPPPPPPPRVHGQDTTAAVSSYKVKAPAATTSSNTAIQSSSPMAASCMTSKGAPQGYHSAGSGALALWHGLNQSSPVSQALGSVRVLGNGSTPIHSGNLMVTVVFCNTW
jgi:hypothetical protein